MILNGTHYTTYKTDTVAILTARIAAMYNSLPKWLIISPPIPHTKEELDIASITVVDFLSSIRNQHTLSVPPQPYPQGVTREEVHDIFIATNKSLEEANGRNDNSLNALLASIRGDIYKNPDTIWMNRYSIIGKLDKEILQNKTNSKEIVARAVAFDTIPMVTYTECDLDRSQFTVDFGVYSGSLAKLFDNTSPNIFVPYITCSNCVDGECNVSYKVYSDFRINPEWIMLKLTNVILFKINSERVYREVTGINRFKHYTNGALTVTDAGKLVCTIDAIMNKERNLTKEEYVDRILTALGTDDFTIPTIYHDNLVVSHFAIPNQCFDPVIFADIVMLNDTVNRFVALDEFIHASRIVTNSVYVKLVTDDTDLSPDAGSITLKQTEYIDEYRMKSIGTWYVLCRLRTKTAHAAKVMQMVISKLLTVYNNEYEAVAADYKSIIGFDTNKCINKVRTTKRIQKIKGLKGLRGIEPEIFYPKFTRQCTNPPIVINSRSETANEVMEFPAKNERGRDGKIIKPRLYTCDTEAHKYIGLRTNDLANNKLFPYVPCCFAKNQSEKKGSAYRSYFFSEAIRKKATVNESVVSDQVIMENIPIIKRIGVSYDEPIESPQSIEFEAPQYAREGNLLPLPPNLEQFFKLISMNPLLKFERRVIRDSKISAIEAILLARHQIKYKRMRVSTINNRIQKVFSTLVNNIDSYANAAKQELYFMKPSEITNALLNHRLSPKLFIRVLELLLDCNLFVFNADGLIVPSHSCMYIKFKPSIETFLLLEHESGIVDLIGHRETFGPPESFNAIFKPLGVITKTIYSIFRKMTVSYCNMKELPPPRLSRMNIAGQVIDSHGKCRAFVLNAKDKYISLVPDNPLPPFVAPVVNTLPRTTIKALKKAINAKIIANCVIVEKRVRNNKTREVVIRMELVFTVLVDDVVTDDDISVATSKPKYDYINATSAVAEYSRNKHNALKFLQDTINEVSDVVNSESVSLDTALLRYANSHGGLTSDNKRLLYACRQWMLTHAMDNCVNLLNPSILDTDIPMTYVLNGEEAIQNLITTYEYDSTHVYDNLVNTKARYYFKPAKSDEIYIVVPVKTIEEATKSIYEWLLACTPFDLKIYAYMGSNKPLIEIKSGDDANGCKIVMNPHIERSIDDVANGRIMALLRVS